MQRLGGYEAGWLYMESRETPSNIGAVQVFQEPAEGSFYELFRTRMIERLHVAPLYRWRLAMTPLAIDHPHWEENVEVDIDEHVLRMRLRTGTWAELAETCARLQGEPLDRSRPLWQYVVIEGLEGGLAALFCKLHHCFIDGAQGKALTQALYDALPGKSEPQPTAAPDRAPTRRSDWLDLVGSVLGSFAAQPAMLLAQSAGLAEAVTRARGRVTRRRPDLPVLPMQAPRTPFNRNVSRARSYALFSVPMNDVKSIKDKASVTLNDVVLAIAAGALRNYLAEQNALPKRSLIALAPVNVRREGDASFAPRLSGMLVDLATDIEDPVERLLEIHESAERGKAFANETRGALIQDYVLPGASMLVGGAARAFAGLKLAEAVQPTFNVLISNVPTTPFPLYLNGCRMVGNYPISMVGHGAGLNITVQSYNGALDFGITACRKAVPRPERIAELLRGEIFVLGEAVGADLEIKTLKPSVAPVRKAVRAKAAAQAGRVREPRKPTGEGRLLAAE